MDLTDDEIRDLAAFLARRVTPDGQRPDPTDAPAAGLTPHQAWERRLSSARSSGGVARAVREAAAAAPEDRALQEASTLLASGRSERAARWPALVGAAGVLGAVALATVLALPVHADTISAARIHPRTAIRPPSPGEPEASVAAPAVADAATRAGDDGPDALAPRVAPGLPALGVATRVPRVEDGPPEGPMERGCSGWFYAGREAPDPSYVVERRTHVRAVHPSRENGWDKKARVTCVLEAGQHVALAGDAVELPGGHFWAPVGLVGVRVASAD